MSPDPAEQTLFAIIISIPATIQSSDESSLDSSLLVYSSESLLFRAIDDQTACRQEKETFDRGESVNLSRIPLRVSMESRDRQEGREGKKSAYGGEYVVEKTVGESSHRSDARGDLRRIANRRTESCWTT